MVSVVNPSLLWHLDAVLGSGRPFHYYRFGAGTTLPAAFTMIRMVDGTSKTDKFQPLAHGIFSQHPVQGGHVT